MALVESSKSRQVEGSPYHLFIKQGQAWLKQPLISHCCRSPDSIPSQSALFIYDMWVISVCFLVLSGPLVLVWLFRVMGVESRTSHSRP